YETRTEAATRYEKAIDPNRCDSALSLAMQLFTTLYPDHTVKGFRDVYAQPQPPVQIVLSQKWLERRLGKAIPAETIADKLGRLGFTVLFDGDQMQVTVPSWRATGDVSIKADIMEEVARMIGYENFEPAPITTTFSGAINQLDIALERKMKEYLAIRCGLQEIFTYPWMQDQFRDAILGSSKGQLFLAAPPSPDESSLRSSLLPNLCKAVTVNQHTYEEFGIFESAQILKDTQYEAVYDDRELLPLQRRMIAGALVGKTQEIESLFRSAKGILFAMPRYTHMEAFHFEKKEKPYWADDVVWLNIFVGEQIVGNLGLLSGKASMECGIKNRVIVLFELDVDAMKPFLSRTNQFEHLPEYPMTQYDASLLVDLSVQWEQIEAIVTEKKGEWIREVSFVDEYRGKQIPEDQKSVTIRLLVGSTEKTLTSAEIEKAASTVLKRLEKRLNAKLRDK
ncbi:MAG: phenylalanine--tRNA ligase subunit beta, partial [Lachnospiraceae bacterium]|nr:phenylalanine--tRNA ligase subunit beta [Lachnospiraceae bacterium]